MLAAEAKVLDPAQPHDVAEVLNYVAAMNHGLARLAALPVSVRLIREIHARLLQGVRGSRLTPGELRTSQNWIGPAGCTLRDATFVPPPPADVPEALGALEHFLHGGDTLPLLVRIGLAHAQFETIHPFLDGNGRVGRLLITFLLCEKQALSKPVLYLSHYFKRHRQRYYDHLQAVRDGGAFEAWLEFFLTGVIDVSLEAAATARRILLLRERHRALIADRLGRAAGNGHRTLEHLFAHPIVSVHEVRALTGTTYPAANQLVERLTAIGILAEVTGHARNRRFRYDPYVRLFAEDPPDEANSGDRGAVRKPVAPAPDADQDFAAPVILAKVMLSLFARISIVKPGMISRPRPNGSPVSRSGCESARSPGGNLLPLSGRLRWLRD